MSENRMRRLTAGLGGMAIALVLIELVVQQARANGECDACTARAYRGAAAGPCKQYKDMQPYYYYEGCMTSYLQQHCYQGDNPPCPGPTGDGTNCTSVSCRSTGVQIICRNDPNAGDNCANECDKKPCRYSWYSTGKCATLPADQLDGGGYPPPTPCATKCACN